MEGIRSKAAPPLVLGDEECLGCKIMRARSSVGFVLGLLLLSNAWPAPAFGQERQESGVAVSWIPEKPEQGDAMVVTVEAEGSVSKVEGRFIDRDLIFFPWGEGSWKAFAPIPVGARTGERPLTVTVVSQEGGRSQSRASVALLPHDFQETELRVDPRFIKPPEEERPRIRRDRQMIREAFAVSKDERLWRLPFVRPVEGRRTSPFGTRRTFNGEIRSRHMGVDFDGRPGDPIKALTDGEVVLAHDLYYAGRSVFIDHGHHLFTVYFHLTDIEVEVGERVEAGQRIGTVGATGRVTGPHLHLGVRVQGRYVNPERFLELSLGDDPRHGRKKDVD